MRSLSDFSPAGRRKEGKTQVGCDPISHDEIVSLSDLTVARNRVLEAEVKTLVEKVSKNLLSDGSFSDLVPA